MSEIANVLYAEAANDPEGWLPKLNVYWMQKKPKESFEDVVQRVSSAQKKKSPQYLKASKGELNEYEKSVYNAIEEAISTFKPDPEWKYFHHENPEFYENELDMIKKLQKAWGTNVDFSNRVKIGKEYYFPLKGSHGIKSLKRE